MSVERRLLLVGAIGVGLLLAAAVSDFLTGSFWERHALLASLVANVLVVALTVAFVNELLERRARRRWQLLAQGVLFELIQSARATWTGLVELLGVAEVRSGAVEPLVTAAGEARELESTSQAIRETLASPERRASLQRASVAMSRHATEVIARWAPVMVGSGPYAEALDRHVELAGRLQWLSDVMVHNEPLEGLSVDDRVLARSSVATERADEFGDDWLHDQILTIVLLATELDYSSREQAYALVPMGWWAQRTAGLPSEPAPGR